MFLRLLCHMVWSRDRSRNYSGKAGQYILRQQRNPALAHRTVSVVSQMGMDFLACWLRKPSWLQSTAKNFGRASFSPSFKLRFYCVRECSSEKGATSLIRARGTEVYVLTLSRRWRRKTSCATGGHMVHLDRYPLFFFSACWSYASGWRAAVAALCALGYCKCDPWGIRKRNTARGETRTLIPKFTFCPSLSYAYGMDKSTKQRSLWHKTFLAWSLPYLVKDLAAAVVLVVFMIELELLEIF